jgi:cell division cycle 20-like protein 1 (cofactor of APC complex)
MQVLDAPALADDFYLNLVDWSAQNLLAVGLDSCVYLWSAHTSKVSTSQQQQQQHWTHVA